MATLNKIKTKLKYNPWLYQGEEITETAQFPKNTIGFVYHIYNTRTKKYYYGRKTVFSSKGNGKYKKVKELPWKNYHGSNKQLNEEVNKGDVCIRTIIKFCKTKAELTLEESKNILCNNALEDINSYNMWIMCRIYKKNLIDT